MRLSPARKVAVGGCCLALLGFVAALVLRVAGAGHGALLVCHSLAFAGFAVALGGVIKAGREKREEKGSCPPGAGADGEDGAPQS